MKLEGLQMYVHHRKSRYSRLVYCVWLLIISQKYITRLIKIFTIIIFIIIIITITIIITIIIITK